MRQALKLATDLVFNTKLYPLLAGTISETMRKGLVATSTKADQLPITDYKPSKSISFCAKLRL